MECEKYIVMSANTGNLSHSKYKMDYTEHELAKIT